MAAISAHSAVVAVHSVDLEEEVSAEVAPAEVGEFIEAQSAR